MRTGATRAFLNSEGMQPVVRDELMRKVRNGRRSPEVGWRRQKGIGSSGQVVGRPDLTSHRMSSRERGERGQGIGSV